MRDRWYVVGAVTIAVLAGVIGAVSYGTTPIDDGDGHASLDAATQVDQLHDAGIAGTNVSVGVVDVTGFRVEEDAIAGQVTAARSFTGSQVATAETTHGTAAAATVARTAPEADLYLASVDDGDSFAAAMDWLAEEDVDVVVAPIAAYGRPDDASGAYARAAARAADRGIVVVAPTGNLGQSHWSGRYEGGGTLEFQDGPRNYLVGDGGEAVLWLSWPRSAANESYRIALYGTEDGRTWLAGESTAYPETDAPAQRLTADLDADAQYFAVVRGTYAGTQTRLTLTSPTHAFEHRQRRGSVTSPAVAEAVVSTGAYGPGTRVSVPYSSAGPLEDGRRGVDVLGPAAVDAPGAPADFEGTSTASAYVAGVAALVVDANEDLRAAEVRALLREHAEDSGLAGVDPLAGHGRVVPQQSVAAARNMTG